MSTGNEYNQYGQILASGGEKAIAFATLRIQDMFKVRARLEKKYGPMPDSVWQKLLGVADDIVKSGETLERLPVDETPLPGMLPRNPFLFGDDWSGKRVRIITHTTDPETGGSVDFWWDLPDLYSRAELEEYWADKRRIQMATPEIILAERRY